MQMADSTLTNLQTSTPMDDSIAHGVLPAGLSAVYHQVQVRARDTFKFYVRVDHPHQELHFSFYTRRKNIAFGLFYLYQAHRVPDMTYQQVSDLIRSRRDSVRIERVGQEGTLARARSQRPGPSSNGKAGASVSLLTPTLSRRNSLESIATAASIETPGLSPSPALSEASSMLGPLEQDQRIIGSIGELIDLLPISKYASFDFTVNGHFEAPLAGTYVLLFDNTFSISTSKHLFYRVAVFNHSPSLLSSSSLSVSQPLLPQRDSICAAGWLIKRRYGVVRAWGRRWFELDSSGVLSYYYDRASPLRGSIFVPDCSLIIARSQLRFSLDSGASTFHLRAVNEDDFYFWIEVLNSFKNFGPPTLADSSHKLPRLEATADASDAVLKQDLSVAIRASHEAMLKLQESITSLSFVSDVLRDDLDGALRAFNGLQCLLTEHVDMVSPKRTTEEPPVEEVFYDVQEVYVDAISDADEAEESGSMESGESDHFEESMSDLGMETTGPLLHADEEEIFSEALDLVEEDYRRFMPPTLPPRSASYVANRHLVEWLAGMSVDLERDGTALYRTKMPFPAPPINVSLASVILQKNFPVALNEPINILQRLAEELEYSELLDGAAGLQDRPIEQLAAVTSFAVSAYASSVHRAERKPYNPVLGETFEYIRPDKGFRFVSEKVCHNPVVVACHAESLQWTFWQDLQAETKFWGKSVLITPRGRIHLQFRDPASGQVLAHYSWCKVVGALRNIFSSKKTVENFGELVVRNELTGDEARVSFKESGMFSGSGNEVLGGIYPAGATAPVSILRGRWDDMLFREVEGNAHEATTVKTRRSGGQEPLLQVLWKANPMPSNYAQFFYLSFYAITLNDLPDALRPHLPLTDSRFRPDQRMLEAGMVDAADFEKQRLEQLQRDLRTRRDAEGVPWKPLWFAYDPKSQSWAYTNRYWQERSQAFANTQLPCLW